MDAKGIPNDNMVKNIIKDININNIIFESPRKNQQIYFLTNFGQDTNLGNIAPSDVISLETLRRGLRGDTVNQFYEVIGDRHLKNQKIRLMSIKIKHGYRSAKEAALDGESIIIIDVLRASSTYTTAIACGAKQIIPCEDRAILLRKLKLIEMH